MFLSNGIDDLDSPMTGGEIYTHQFVLELSQEDSAMQDTANITQPSKRKLEKDFEDMMEVDSDFFTERNMDVEQPSSKRPHKDISGDGSDMNHVKKQKIANSKNETRDMRIISGRIGPRRRSSGRDNVAIFLRV